jgi:pyruvate kinase
VDTFEELTKQAENYLLSRNLAKSDDKILIMGGIPTQIAGGTNFLKIHKITGF